MGCTSRPMHLLVAAGVGKPPIYNAAACGRWFGQKFINFTVRRDRVTCTQCLKKADA